MSKQLTNGQVDRVERRLRKHEHDLESTGRDICPAVGGAETWNAINDALESVREAIRQCWRMRPLIAIVALLAVLPARAEKIDYGRLLDAIAMVESDRWATSRNIYQIRRIYWNDVNRFMRWNWHPASYRDMVHTKVIAEDYILAYWEHYGRQYTADTGKPVTAEVLARIHNGGPDGWRKRATVSYWRRVRRHYERRAK